MYHTKKKWVLLPLWMAFALLWLGGCSQEESPAEQPVTAPLTEQTSAQDDVSDEDGENTEGVPQAETTDNDSGAPSIVSLKLVPVPAFPGTTLTAVTESVDPDDDLVTYSYRWLRNNEPVDSDFEEFDTSGFSKGDLIAVEVTPSDSDTEGETKKSLPVLLHNRPPEITSFPSGLVDGRFIYRVTASDPDDDILTFSLEGAPVGMEIDAESGVIDWTVPLDLSGKYQVRILASDGDAKSYQTFSLSFSLQQ